jgi:hypothetical protein
VSEATFTFLLVCCAIYGLLKGFSNPAKYAPRSDPAITTLRVAGAYRLLKGWR